MLSKNPAHAGRLHEYKLLYTVTSFLWEALVQTLAISAHNSTSDVVRKGLYVVLTNLSGVLSLVEQRRQVLPFLGTDKARTALFELAIEGAVD